MGKRSDAGGGKSTPNPGVREKELDYKAPDNIC